MEAMSSADFAPKEEPKSGSTSPQKYTDALNKLSDTTKESEESGTGFAAKKAPGKSTF